MLEPGSGNSCPSNGNLVRMRLVPFVAVPVPLAMEAAILRTCQASRQRKWPASMQVYLHYAVKTPDDEILYSTFSADDGSGIPQPFVLGKGMRMPRGWEIGLQSAFGPSWTAVLLT